MWKRSILFGWLAAAGFLVPAARAETINLDCTETLPAPDESGATAAEHRIAIAEGDSATLTFEGPWGTIVLRARINRLQDASMPDAIAVNAFGEASLRMPVKADVDACMAEARTRNPEYFEGDEINDFIAIGCRNKAALTPEPVPVTISVEVAIFDPPEVASFFVERAYAGDDENARRLYGVASLPPWNCRMVQ